jgi:hypothetical protein
MGSTDKSYKLNKTILNILDIEDRFYNNVLLRKALTTKLKVSNRKLNTYYLTKELQVLFNEDNNFTVNIDTLVSIIVNSYSENINYPDCQFYSYNQSATYIAQKN